MSNNFEKDLSKIKYLLTEFYLSWSIHPEADFVDLAKYNINNIDDYFNFFKENLKNTSEIFNNLFNVSCFELIKLLIKQSEEIKDLSDEEIFKFFNDKWTILYYSSRYETLPNYKEEIIKIGRSIVNEFLDKFIELKNQKYDSLESDFKDINELKNKLDEYKDEIDKLKNELSDCKKEFTDKILNYEEQNKNVKEKFSMIVDQYEKEIDNLKNINYQKLTELLNNVNL
jgi:vacuolar-type H+-ATPase subunit I/STV1